MQEFAYFNIGFRSENVYQQLSYYENGNEYNKNLIKNSIQIIQDCFKIEESLSGLSFNEAYEITDLIPLILEIYKDSSINDIVENLKKIADIVNDVSEGKEGVDINYAKEFFFNLSEICLSKSSNLSSFEHHALL